MNSITIIGGGISGLYLLYKLLLITNQNDVEITLIEKNKYLGGRIYTHREQIDNQFVSMECGAGRLGSKDAQPLLHNLLDTLSLTSKLIKGSTSDDYSTFLHMLSQFSDEQLRTHTVKQLITIDPLLFGYDAEFECMNAYLIKKYIERHFNGYHYFLKDGLDQIIHTLSTHCSQHSNVKILTNSYVSEVGETYCRLRNGTLILHNKVYLTLPPRNYLQLRFPLLLKDSMYNLNASVCPVALCRVFVGLRNFTLPKNKITHEGPIRMFIPMNTYNTFVTCQIYTDSKWAKWWNEHRDRQDVIVHEIQKLFHLQQRPEYVFHRVAFWKNGVHLWKPNKLLLTKEDLQPYPWITFCGESVSKESQGWIEGALESVENIFS